MLGFFDFMREMTFPSIAARLVLAVLCGGVIGIEREYKRRPAGFRTHILICLGAAMTTLTSLYLYLVEGLYTDVARLGAQVIAGVGFIGAGTIIVTRRRRVKGLTTAAGLWTSAIVGLAIGAGYVECALFATLLILVAERVLIRLEYRVVSDARELNLYIEYRGADSIETIIQLLRDRKIRTTGLEITRSESEDRRYCAVLSLQLRRGSHKDELLNALAGQEQVLSVEEL